MAKGGARPGAGRPPKAEEDKLQRPQHQIRAFDDEWELIRKFARYVKHGRKKDCEKLMEELENNI